MIGLAIVALGAVFTAAMQVSVAPLFPLGGATADLGMAAILLALAASGPRAAMLMTPAVALAIALASDLAPAVLLTGYAAVLPVGYALDRYGVPPGNFARLLVMAVVAGAWVRALLSLEALARGAEVPPAALLGQVLAPGALFDAAIATLIFLPLSLLGRFRLVFATQRREWLA